MKKLIAGFLIGFVVGAIGTAIAAGIVKYESASKDAGSVVGYGTSDSGDTIVRFKTDTDGTLYIQ